MPEDQTSSVGIRRSATLLRDEPSGSDVRLVVEERSLRVAEERLKLEELAGVTGRQFVSLLAQFLELEKHKYALGRTENDIDGAGASDAAQRCQSSRGPDGAVGVLVGGSM